MLTVKILEQFPYHTVFASGLVPNSSDGVFMVRENEGKLLRWAAKKGGTEDWAIYIYWAEQDEQWILKNGDKLRDTTDILGLVPCDSEAIKLYRK